MKKKISFSLLNQATVSFINVSLNLYLAKYASLDEYGKFGVIFSAATLLLGFCTSVFINPHLINKPYTENKKIKNSTAIVVFFLCVLFFVQIFSIVVNLFYQNPGFNFFAAATFCCVFALKDYIARIMFIYSNGFDAFLLNFLSALFICATILFLHPVKSYYQIILVFSIFCILFLLKHVIKIVKLNKVQFIVAIKNIKNLVIYSRWSVFGVFLVWLQSQCYIYVEAMYGDYASVAKANISRLYVAPVIMLMPAISQVAILRAINNNKLSERSKILVKYAKIQLLFLLIYSLCLYIFKNTIDKIILQNQIEDINILIITWIGYVFFLIIRDAASSVLLTVGDYKYITIANSVSFIFCLFSYFLLKWLGLLTLFSLVIGEVFLAIFVWTRIFYVKKNQ